jgi:branched-chain amino acid transport system permease protein
VLRLAGLVNGWVLFWGIAVVAVAIRAYAGARATPAPASSPGPGPAEDPVPIEWRGLSRPWRAEDEEVLDRAIARG